MITLDLVTPVKKILENGHVSSLKIPTRNGEIEVLPGHTELLTLLDVGVLSFVQEGKGPRRFAISYGFAEIRKDKVILLAETCEESNAIDVGRAKTAGTKAETKLKGLMTESEFRKYQLKLNRSATRQKVTQ